MSVKLVKSIVQLWWKQWLALFLVIKHLIMLNPSHWVGQTVKTIETIKKAITCIIYTIY